MVTGGGREPLWEPYYEGKDTHSPFQAAKGWGCGGEDASPSFQSIEYALKHPLHCWMLDTSAGISNSENHCADDNSAHLKSPHTDTSAGRNSLQHTVHPTAQPTLPCPWWPGKDSKCYSMIAKDGWHNFSLLHTHTNFQYTYTMLSEHAPSLYISFSFKIISKAFLHAFLTTMQVQMFMYIDTLIALSCTFTRYYVQWHEYIKEAGSIMCATSSSKETNQTHKDL